MAASAERLSEARDLAARWGLPLGEVGDEGYRLVLTDQGRYLWVMAMREFFIAVDTMRDVCRAQAGITE